METIISRNEIKNMISENKSISDFIKGKVLEHVKILIEMFLELEFEEYREKIRDSKNRQRNGYYMRNLLTRYGLIENIRVPRFRNMKFHTIIFNKWQRSWSEVENFITKLFIQGESYRDIKRIANELYGKYTMSLTTINRISNKFLEEVKKFHERRIEKEYNVIELVEIMSVSVKILLLHKIRNTIPYSPNKITI